MATRRLPLFETRPIHLQINSAQHAAWKTSFANLREALLTVPLEIHPRPCSSMNITVACGLCQALAFPKQSKFGMSRYD